MTADAGATTVLLVGALLVRLSVSGVYTRYVRVGMGPWLLVAGILLGLLGLIGVVRALRTQRAPDPEHGDEPGHGATHREEHGDEHGHGERHGDGHGHGERAGWLLLGPVLALLLVTPPALGSYGVGRGTRVDVTASGTRTFRPLTGTAPVPMSLLEFDQRAAEGHGASFGATPVRLTGFVANRRDGAGFLVARYQIACCAADAIAAVVRVIGTSGEPPSRDRWVTVTGTFRSAGDVPELLASSLAEEPAPADPYE